MLHAMGHNAVALPVSCEVACRMMKLIAEDKLRELDLEAGYPHRDERQFTVRSYIHQRR